MREGRIPPQAIDIEKVVLGAILISSYCLPEVIDLIFKEVFYIESHQMIFEAIISLYDKNRSIDILTVVEELINLGNIEKVGGPYYVTILTNDVTSSAHIDHHCRILLEKYLKREAIKIGGEFVISAYEDGTDAFEIYDKADNDILNTQERVIGSTMADMNSFSSMVYDQYEKVKATGVLGINTGIIPFDRIFGGLVPPDLFIIAARPGAGKTALAMSITHHVSVIKKIPGAWFSLEMDGVQLTRRLASIDSKISHELIRQGKVSEADESKFYDSLNRISSAPIFIEDKTSVNIRSIRTRANILVRKKKIQYIIVDYLQLMGSVNKKNQNREGEISDISRGLKTLAKELGIPVIALSQLSREVEKRSDKMPQLSDLRESGAIEQDADEVLFLMRPEYYGFLEDVEIGNKNYSTKGLCIGKGAKNRHGACENFAMWFDAPCMHFSTHVNDLGYVPINFNNNLPYKDDNPF